MSSRLRALDSSVGTKVLIGLTGLALFLYLITHIAGNALVFFGPTVFNQYAATLMANPLIPLIEIGLVAVFVLHIYKTVKMYAANRRARPTSYVLRRPAGPPSRKNLASTTMILTGVWLLIFIVLHVRAFRYGAEYQTATGVRDLYRVEMENFSNPLTVAFYVVSMVIVGSHLWHGVSSASQSLGVEGARWSPWVRKAGKAMAVVIAGGFIVIALWAHFVGGRS
jgi:succinate dehydrogenase / fumarate reductase cytochrome b subunit